MISGTSSIYLYILAYRIAFDNHSEDTSGSPAFGKPSLSETESTISSSRFDTSLYYDLQLDPVPEVEDASPPSRTRVLRSGQLNRLSWTTLLPELDKAIKADRQRGTKSRKLGKPIQRMATTGTVPTGVPPLDTGNVINDNEEENDEERETNATAITPVVLPAAQLRQFVRESRRPNFRDISKFSGAPHKNVFDWLLAYERYGMVYDWTDHEYQKYLNIAFSQDALQWLVSQPLSSSCKDLKEGLEAVYGKNRIDFDLESESGRMFAGENLVRHVAHIKRYIRATTPEASEAEIVNGLFDGLPTYLKAYFVDKIDHIPSSDQFQEHLRKVARAYGYQEQGLMTLNALGWDVLSPLPVGPSGWGGYPTREAKTEVVTHHQVPSFALVESKTTTVKERSKTATIASLEQKLSDLTKQVVNLAASSSKSGTLYLLTYFLRILRETVAYGYTVF